MSLRDNVLTMAAHPIKPNFVMLLVSANTMIKLKKISLKVKDLVFIKIIPYSSVQYE